MQSMAVCSRTAARSLIGECAVAATAAAAAASSTSTAVATSNGGGGGGCTKTSAALSNRLFTRLLSNLRYLSQTLGQPQTAATTASTTPLNLVTAYSGYSKEFNSAAPAKCSMQYLSRKRGVIGDDAWFISSSSTRVNGSVEVLGVADGVGGWRAIGVDPSKFSSTLMRTCKRLVEQELNSNPHHNDTVTLSQAWCAQGRSSSGGSSISLGASVSGGVGGAASRVRLLSPVDILSAAYATLLDTKTAPCVGSSTACLIVFNGESNLLHTANLGDSGFVVVRNNRVVHRSQAQKHYFNSPFQMAILPPAPPTRTNSDHEVTNGDEHTPRLVNAELEAPAVEDPNTALFNDSPDAAAVSEFKLCEGDFIVLATDGLWDNLNEYSLLIEIAKIKSYLLEDLEKAAQKIARKAIELAFDPDYMSPFAIAARQSGINIIGGKPDDVTVLLARVTR